MLRNFDTVCLHSDINISFSDRIESSTFEAKVHQPSKHILNFYSIIWSFRFYTKNMEVYSEIFETHFFYKPAEQSIGFISMEQDFIDIRRFIVICILYLQQNIIAKDQRLVFPEVNILKLTCGIFEQVIKLNC